MLEFGDDRGPVHGAEMERVYRGVMRWLRQRAAPSPGASRRPSIQSRAGSLPQAGEVYSGHGSRRFRSAAVLGVFLLVPMVTLVVVSFFDYDSVQIIPGFVLTNYRDVLFSATTWWTYLETLKFTA